VSTPQHSWWLTWWQVPVTTPFYWSLLWKAVAQSCVTAWICRQTWTEDIKHHFRWGPRSKVQWNRAILLDQSHKFDPQPHDQNQAKPTWHRFGGKITWLQPRKKLEGELMVWRTKMQASVQLKDSICFKWVRLVPRNVEPVPTSKVDLNQRRILDVGSTKLGAASFFPDYPPSRPRSVRRWPDTFWWWCCFTDPVKLAFSFVPLVRCLGLEVKTFFEPQFSASTCPPPAPPQTPNLLLTRFPACWCDNSVYIYNILKDQLYFSLMKRQL
jgi:hypothetical protein